MTNSSASIIILHTSPNYFFVILLTNIVHVSSLSHQYFPTSIRFRELQHFTAVKHPLLDNWTDGNVCEYKTIVIDVVTNPNTFLVCLCRTTNLILWSMNCVEFQSVRTTIMSTKHTAYYRRYR